MRDSRSPVLSSRMVLGACAVALVLGCGSSANSPSTSSSSANSSSTNGSSTDGSSTSGASMNTSSTSDAAASGSGGAVSSGGSTGSGGGGGAAQGYAIAEWLGLNGFINDPTELFSVGGFFREYHPWEWNQHYWDGQGEHVTDTSQMVFQGLVGTWDQDDFLKRASDANVTAFPAVMGTIPALSGSTDFPKPMAQTANPKDPASYKMHAQMMYQFSARYGSVKVDASKLTLAAGQKALSGLGYLKYVENGNEPDNIWAYNLNGKAMPQLPDEFAAMSSADYDGHMGTLGAGVGAKTADPNMQVVMAGLAGTSPGSDQGAWLDNIKAYLKGIKDWSDAHRGGSFPADVINVHYYCQDNTGMTGIAPEACKLEETLRATREYVDTIAPGKQLWLTELGYDRVSTGSWDAAPPIAGYDAETVQAQWLVRATVAILLAGVDRYSWYMTRDAGASGLYATCGLAAVDLSNNVLGTISKRYAAFDYFTTFRTRLGAMRLDREITTGDPRVRAVRFVDPKGSKGFVVWSPTTAGTKVDAFELTVGAGTSARLVDLAKGAPNGNEHALTINAGSVTLSVSENPSIVLVP